MKGFGDKTRGASGMTYGVMLGLIGVVALLAVTRLGLTTSNLFCTTSSGLSGEPGCTVQSVPDAPALPTPMLSIGGGGAPMNVTGPGNPAYSAPVLLTISNGGTAASGVPTPQITPTNRFEITTTTCTAPLNPGQSCTATIRARAVDNGTLSGSFSIAADNAPSIALSGTASSFSSTLTLTGSNTGMNVSGPGNPAYGTPVDFTLTNTSAITSAAPTVAVSPTTNFTITTNGCTAALAAGASCTITVRPQANVNGSLSATLAVTANNNPSIALSGTASGFTPTLTLTGSNTGMNVTGPGNPAYGTPVNFTLTNTSAITSAVPSAAISPATNFAITTNGCTAALAAGASCTIAVRPQATANGSLSATLTVTANNNPSIALSGTGSGFNTAQISCQAWRDLGYTADGSYSIDPDGAGTLTTAANAYCDMDGTNGWTLIAYNNAPTTFTNFNKTWAEFKAGFGSPASGSLGLGWIGNDRINALTVGGKQLKVQIDSNTAHLYNGFTVANEANKYRMTYSTSTGSPNSIDNNMLAYHSGYNFTTSDSDNDAWGSNCASYYAAGWWYQSCYYMTIAGSNTGRVYWRNSAGDLEYVYTAISMWVK